MGLREYPREKALSLRIAAPVHFHRASRCDYICAGRKVRNCAEVFGLVELMLRLVELVQGGVCLAF
jgi:hypothetical protein